MGTSNFAAFDRIDFDAPWARRLSGAVAVVAAFAACVAGGVALYTSVVGRFPAAPYLLIPGVPLLAIGQLWCVVILIRRVDDRRRAAGGNARWFDGFLWPRDVRGGLPWPAAVGFLLLFYGMIVIEALTMGFGGFFADSAADVPLAEVADQQRFAACAFAAFYVAHCGVATGEVLLRRRGDRAATRAGA